MKSLTTVAALAAVLCCADARADAREDVLAAFEKAMAQKSYRAVSTTEVDGKPLRTTIDMQPPATFHMKNADTEVIVLPGATWMNAGGQWMKVPMDMSAMIKGMTVQAMREGADSVKDVRALGEAEVEGCQAQQYAYRADAKVMGMSSSADVELAVCEDTGLPIRIVSSDPNGKHRTEVVYDYAAEIDIRAPN